MNNTEIEEALGLIIEEIKVDIAFQHEKLLIAPTQELRCHLYAKKAFLQALEGISNNFYEKKADFINKINEHYCDLGAETVVDWVDLK